MCIRDSVNAISEAVAETDEVLFDKYFSGEKYTHEEMIQGIHKGVFDGTITPVFCGSSFTMEGIDLLMEDMVEIDVYKRQVRGADDELRRRHRLYERDTGANLLVEEINTRQVTMKIVACRVSYLFFH